MRINCASIRSNSHLLYPHHLGGTVKHQSTSATILQLQMTNCSTSPCRHEIEMGIDERSMAGKCVGEMDGSEKGGKGETEVRSGPRTAALLRGRHSIQE
jgi:hypothetical protein